MNPEVDASIGRSDQWPAEMIALRQVLLSGGLTEEIKWRKPGCTHDEAHIVILQEMKTSSPSCASPRSRTSSGSEPPDEPVRIACQMSEHVPDTPTRKQ